MEYLGQCFVCQGLLVAVTSWTESAVVDQSPLFCHCVEHFSKPPEPLSVTVVRHFSGYVRYTVRGIPALENVPRHLEKAALTMIRYTEEVRRFLRQSRYQHIRNDDILD